MTLVTGKEHPGEPEPTSVGHGGRRPAEGVAIGESAAWVRVGGAMLYVGGETGTIVGPAGAPEEAQRARLAEALADMRAEPSPLETAERLLETGKAGTARIEQVREALELLLQGADAEQVIDQLDGWVGELHRCYKGGDYEGVIRLARVLTGVLILAFRWRDLVTVLGLAVAAAHQVGNAAAEAWALRELGSLAVAAGDKPLATDLLGRARELFEATGDHEAAQQAAANLHQQLTAPASLSPPGARSLVERVLRHKIAAGTVTGAVAVLALVPMLGGRPEAEIVAFSAASSKNAPGAYDERRGHDVPGTAAEPGGVLEACDPLYLVAYVRYSNMSRSIRVVEEAKIGGEFAAKSAFRWSRSDDFTNARLAYIHTEDRPDVSSGDPVPAGRWRYTVSLDGELRDAETVTLKKSCP